MAGWLDQKENAARQVETEKTPTRRGARERKGRSAFRNAMLGRPRTHERLVREDDDSAPSSQRWCC